MSRWSATAPTTPAPRRIESVTPLGQSNATDAVATALTIAGTSISLGETKDVRIPVAKLPMGTLIDLPLHVFRGPKPGPTLLLQAGLHGDEVNGIELLRRMVREGQFNLVSGTAIVVPVLNVFGFIHSTREAPDGKDVNRSFPGSKRGSLAARIAHSYLSNVVPHIDLAIDFHTGGGRRHNYPQVRYTASYPETRVLAEVFGAPFVMPSGLIRKSFRAAMTKRRIPTIVYEAGESLRLDPSALQHGTDGALRVMAHLGLINDAPTAGPSQHLERSTWLRASRAGLFHSLVTNGMRVEKGQPLGHIADPYESVDTVIKASRSGWVVCINHLAVVNQGDALMRLSGESLALE
ncbi:MAG: putative deacylase [Myxococcota bacterium]|jgi:predicted deacylase